MRLGDYVTVNPESIRKDYPFSEIQYIDISSVGTGTLQGTQHLQLSDAPSRAKRIVRNGDTLLATVRPNLKAFWYAQRTAENTIASTGFAVLRAGKKINNRFLYYTVTNQPYTDYLTANAKGAAYPAVDTDTIERAEIFVPPLPTQRKIAAILSAYDDLIENNLRRIKILEEMAQNLYREWFVNFRFPGHEKVKMVDSPLGKIPEGWKVEPLSNLCIRITDGSHSSPKSVETGYPMASVKDMRDWALDEDSCRRIAESDYQTLVRNDCKPLTNDILIAKDGSYLKHAFVVEDEKELVILSSIAILRPNLDQILPHILCMYLRQIEAISRLSGYVSGVALPRIVLKDFAKFLAVIPGMPLQTKFMITFESFVRLIHNLIKRNLTLRKTRDLLLPRLISGEVDVSELDIKISEENGA